MMKISQPKTARVINTARVLSLIRNNSSLSKAEIARLLELNKVSTGEIVDSLIEQGLIRETGKIEVSNGRRPTSLALNPDAKYVLAVDIGRKNITTALCNLDGRLLKMERFPAQTDTTEEEFCVSILKSAARTIKLVPSEKLLGIGVAVEGETDSGNRVISESFLPWKNFEIGQAFENSLKVRAVTVNSLEALVSAEKTVNPLLRDTEKLLYLDWGHSIALAIVNHGKVVNTSLDFGHLKCNKTESLEDKCSSFSITGDVSKRLGDVWDEISDDVLTYMAQALNTAGKVTGIHKVIIGGEGSTISQTSLSYLMEKCPGMEIIKSKLGDRAEIQAAAESALDNFFYMTSVLDGMKNYI